MSGWLPLLAAVALLIVVAVRHDVLTSVVGILAAVMMLCTSAIIFAINDPRKRGGSS